MKTPNGRPLSRAEESDALFWHGLDRQAINVLGEAAVGLLRTAHDTDDPWPVVEAISTELTLLDIDAVLDAEAA